LFELYQSVAVSRVQVQAVAAQADFMKRIRRNGGARDILRPKGIGILNTANPDHRAVLHALQVPFGAREFISFRARSARQKKLLRDADIID
jgi:hypothetical protein